MRIYYRESAARTISRAIDKAEAAGFSVCRLSICRRAYRTVAADPALHERLQRYRIVEVNHWVGYHGIGVVHLTNHAEFEMEPRFQDLLAEVGITPVQHLKHIVRAATSNGDEIARIIAPRDLYWEIVENGELTRDGGWNYTPNQGFPFGGSRLEVEGTWILLESERPVSMGVP